MFWDPSSATVKGMHTLETLSKMAVTVHCDLRENGQCCLSGMMDHSADGQVVFQAATHTWLMKHSPNYCRQILEAAVSPSTIWWEDGGHNEQEDTMYVANSGIQVVAITHLYTPILHLASTGVQAQTHPGCNSLAAPQIKTT